MLTAGIVNVVTGPTQSTTKKSICPVALPYVWNGLTFSAAGTKTAHLTNAAGYDSAATLILTVYANTSSTINVSINEGSSYNFGGTNYTTAGTYITHITNTKGCDSAVTLNLTVLANTHTKTFIAGNYTGSGTAITIPITVKNYRNIVAFSYSIDWDTTKLTYQGYNIPITALGFNSTELNASRKGINISHFDGSLMGQSVPDNTTILNINLTAKNGFTGSTPVYFDVIPTTPPNLPAPREIDTTDGNYSIGVNTDTAFIAGTVNVTSGSTSSTTYKTICPVGLPYSWNGLTFNAAGTQTAHLTNAAGFDSAATLILTVSANTTSITNASINAGGSYNFNGNTYTTAGTYTVHLTNIAGCDSVATLNLSINTFIKSFTPATAGIGSTITIKGIGFMGAGAVSFGGIAATSFTVLNDTIVTAVVGNGASGSIQITSPNGTGSLAGFTYNTFVTINSFLPTNASIGTVINIKGKGFTGATAVSFGGKAATSFTVLNDTVLTAIVSNGASGSVQITSPQGTGALSGFTYNTLYIVGSATAGGWSNPIPAAYIPAQQFTAISPNEYKITTTLIGGAEYLFLPSNDGKWTTSYGIHILNDPKEIYGGAISLNSQNIGAPPVSGTYTIDVNLQTNMFTVTAVVTPVINSFAPSSAGNGSTVTLKGKSFTGTTAVSFGGVAATSYLVVNDTVITAVVGTGASGIVSVTTAGGTGILAGFKYCVATTATIFKTVCNSYNWHNKAYTTSGSYIFDSLNVAGCDSLTTLVLTVNASTTSITNVTISSGGFYGFNGINYFVSGTYIAHLANKAGCDSAATLNLTVNPALAITSFLPVSASVGTLVTINGAGFTGASAVSFGGIAATSYTVVNDAVITAMVDAGASGSVSVTAAGKTVTMPGFTYLTIAPAVATTVATAVTARTATVGGTISTTGSSPITQKGVVYNTTGNPTLADNNTTARLTHKIITIAGNNITISAKANSNNNTANAAVTFTVNLTGLKPLTTYYYKAYAINATDTAFANQDTLKTAALAPVINSFSPVNGKAGTIVTIKGTSLTGATVVSFGGVAASSYTVVKDTSINAVVFSGASGSVSITTGGGTGSLAGFNYLAAPIIGYAGTPKSFAIGTAINAWIPNNTGGAAIGKGQISVTTLAGNGSQSSVDGTATTASFDSPYGVAVDATGNVYVVAASEIRKISPTGIVTTLAGNSTGGSADGTGSAASFNGPIGIAVDAAGYLYIGDTYNNKIRKVSPSGVVTTLAGSGSNGSTDGTGSAATFSQPFGVALDAAGNLYVADQSNKIRKVSPSGDVTTLAGSGTGGSADGTGSAASFYYPSGVAVDAAGNVYVTDYYNSKIRKISPAGVVTTLAGSGSRSFADGTGAAASFHSPFGVAVDAAGNVYVGDAGNQKIRKITPAGVVTTIAGSGSIGSKDSIGSAASFYNPSGVAVDAAGNVYVADLYNYKIRKVSPGYGFSISPALPAGLSIDANGTISGIPTVAIPATIYTITATNAQGSSVTTVSIAVAAPPQPVITSFTPANGCTGTSVTIKGTGFTGATAVSFGGTAATSYTVVNDSTITAVVGSSATGVVKVITAGGNANSSSNYTIGGAVVYAYIANSNSSNVSVINTANNTVVATVPVGTSPEGVSVSPDGTKVYVTHININEVRVINTANNTVVATVSVGTSPYGVSVSPDGAKVYVTNERSNTVSVINTASNTVIATVAVGGTPNGVSVSPDGSNVYVTNGFNTVSVINTATNTVIATVTVGTTPISFGNFIATVGSPCVVASKINSFAPGTASAGTTVTIKGVGFTGATAVSFGAVAAGSYTVVNDTTITAVVGSGASGSVSVTTGGGTGNLAGFVYCLATTATISKTVCGSSYTWHNKTYTIGGTYTFDTLNIIGCDSLTTLNLTFSQPTTATIAKTVCGSYLWHGTNYTTSGTYTFDSLNTKGCDSLTTLNLTINQPTTATINKTICGSYIWHGKTYTITGSYTFDSLNAKGCDSLTTLNLTINQPATATINKVTCVNYLWHGTTYTVNGIYTFDTLNAKGCDSLTTLVLTINALPLVSISNTAATNCLGVANLSVTGAGATDSIKWYNGGVLTNTAMMVSDTNVVTVAGGNGQGSAANQLYSPSGVFVDSSGSIYVADQYNSRIQKFVAGSTTGVTVAGGNGVGIAANQLNFPYAVFVDKSGSIYVADEDNYRIQKFVAGSTVGVTVAGVGGQGSAANQLNQPLNVFVDIAGNIYVTDYGNNRIQKFTPGSSTGITVAGVGGLGSAANQLAYPAGLFVDGSGSIYVGDQ